MSEEEANGQPEEPTHEPEDPELLERRREALALVRKFGDPVLKSPASPIADFGSGLETEAERMVQIMRDSLGIGLAATQLGVMRRMLVFQAGPDAAARALINPEVQWTSEDAVTAEEGCLSLPGVVVDVERPLHARIAGVDTAGAEMLIEASGLEARVLQHEIDHLDGVLILDRTERDQRRGALKALRNKSTFSPEMLDPDYDPEGGEGSASEEAENEATSSAER